VLKVYNKQVNFDALHTVRMYVYAAKVHFVLLWPWPFTSDLENLLDNGHSHDECLCQVSLKFFH